MKESIIDAIDCLIGNYRIKFTEEEKRQKLKAWSLGLNNLTDDQISKGLLKALNLRSGFFPTCGEFKELCVSSGTLLTVEDEASKAWQQVMENLNYTRTTIFKNVVISETIIQMGGWRNLCNMLQSEEPFKKKEFVSTYKSVKVREAELKPLELPGEYNLKQFIGFDSLDDEKLIEDQIAKETKTIKQIVRL